MEITPWARRQVEFLFAPHKSEENGLKHVLGVHDASGDAISGAEDLVVVLPKKDFYLLRRTWHWSEVSYGLHIFLLHFVSSHKTPLAEGY
jgi:hypothetical protein